MKMSSSSSTESRSAWVAAACLVASSTIWYLRRRQSRHDRDASSSELQSFAQGIPGHVGSRGLAAVPPPLSYLKNFFKCLQDPCDPVNNRQGYIGLCIAENKLVMDLIAARLAQPAIAQTAFYNPLVYCYDSFLGLMVAREAAAYFLAKHFLHPERTLMTPEQAMEHVHPTNICIGSGCSGLLNSLFFALGEPGDACLIPAPYYAAFENDMKVMANCVPFPVQMAHPAMGPTTADLNVGYVQAKSKGLRVKFLLLTNPNNPLGVIYSPEIVRNAITWARKRGLDTIMDEIYALSTHKKVGHGFQSVIRVLDNDLGDDVHLVWALSKDLGASGFRVGVLYTQNSLLLESLANLHIFSSVSQPMQIVTAELLTDDAFMDSFLDESRARLFRSYTICVTKLEEMVIPFIPADAGLFVYVDFSSLLKTKTVAGEEMLRELMVEYARVVLTPGESQRDKSPGMFRICYAWVSPEVLEIAMERLSRLVAKVRKMSWDDLNEKSLSSVIDF